MGPPGERSPSAITHRGCNKELGDQGPAQGWGMSTLGCAYSSAKPGQAACEFQNCCPGPTTSQPLLQDGAVGCSGVSMQLLELEERTCWGVQAATGMGSWRPQSWWSLISFTEQWM